MSHEHPAVLKAGEFVVNKRAAARLGPRLVLMNRTAPFDEFSQIGRANRETVLSLVEAAIGYGAAIAEQTGSIRRGMRASRRRIRKLARMAEKYGATGASEYLAQLHLTRKQVKRVIQMMTPAP